MLVFDRVSGGVLGVVGRQLANGALAALEDVDGPIGVRLGLGTLAARRRAPGVRRRADNRHHRYGSTLLDPDQG